MKLGHIIRLNPTAKQAAALVRAAGVSRFTYNWALAEWGRQYKAGGKPNVYALKKQFNAIKREQFPWVMESPRDANSQPFADLGRAFSNFFASIKGKSKGRKVGYPKFRRLGVDDSFYVANDKFKMRSRGKRGVIRLSVIGDVNTTEPLRWQGKILSGCVYRKANHWFIAIAVEVPDVKADRQATNVIERRTVVGVDLGLKTTLVLSDGTRLDAPKPLRASLKRLKRANRKLHRRMKGGNNRNRARVQVAKLHQQIANIRKDFWHKTTTRLCRENQVVVVEDLSIGFMLKNRRLARAASDVGLGMFRPMLLYKAPLHGTQVVVADRFFPSTQRCSSCGWTKASSDRLVLGQSTYCCEKCGVVEDRDFNASLNLEQYPRLAGNWGQVTQTPAETVASARAVRRVSMVDDTGTKPEHILVLSNQRAARDERP